MRAAHQLRQHVADRQAQSGAAGVGVRAGAAAREGFEDMIDFFLQDAGAGIFDFKRRHLARVRNRTQCRRVGELDRVAEDVDQDLPQPLASARTMRGRVPAIRSGSSIPCWPPAVRTCARSDR
jgi:hypothetical protein